MLTASRYLWTRTSDRWSRLGVRAPLRAIVESLADYWQSQERTTSPPWSTCWLLSVES
jgi:hypothetical protein